MVMKYCNMCQRDVDAKRKIGAGSIIGILVTVGWWLLVIPFYGKRCPLCTGKSLSPPKGINANNIQPNQTNTSLSQTDKFAALEKLGELRSKNLITEEEFQKEKSKIL